MDRFLASDKPLHKQEMAFAFQMMEGEARCLYPPEAAGDCAEGQEGCGCKEHEEHNMRSFVNERQWEKPEPTEWDLLFS